MKKVFALFVCVLVVFASIATVSANTATSGYDVVLRDEAPTIDGKLDEAVWATVPVISGDFRYPWEAIEAPLTVFKAFNDGKKLYFSFSVTDAAVLSVEEWAGESTVDDEDRVEMFFAAGPVDLPVDYEIPLYYNIEVDPLGRVHDYSAKYYRVFDSEWNLEGLESAAVMTDAGYDVEGSIPLKSFEDLALLSEDNTMRVGVFRAEFTKPADEIIMQWISWVDPKTHAPDFHVDSAFGEFRIMK